MCFLDCMVQPTTAYYVLLMLGIVGVLFELFNPGFILPAVIGFIALCVALYALHVLPMPYFILVLFCVGVVLVMSVKLVLRSRRRPVQNGENMLMGASGKTLGPVEPRGQAFIQGEIWNVYSKHPIRRDCPIKVIAIKGLCLEIEEQFNEGEE